MLVRLTFDVGNTNAAQSALSWLKFSGSALLSSDIKNEDGSDDPSSDIWIRALEKICLYNRIGMNIIGSYFAVCTSVGD